MTPAIPGTAAIRTGIGLLAAFGFALSYDALRQTAVAIHIRGLLTYAFPLVIDGFIAIGIGALLILRTAPLHARLYVWALVGLATATSIWANALHAVRLNQQTRHQAGLHLDDATVGALSAIAPLALAGAVHLYLLIRRHPTPPVHRADATSSHIRRGDATSSHTTAAGPPEPPQAPSTTSGGSADVAGNAATGSETALPSAKVAEREPDPADEIDGELLTIARTAPLGRKGRASRRHIEAEIRKHGHSVGRKEADKIKGILQAELDAALPQRQVETDAAPVAAP